MIARTLLVLLFLLSFTPLSSQASEKSGGEQSLTLLNKPQVQSLPQSGSGNMPLTPQQLGGEQEPLRDIYGPVNLLEPINYRLYISLAVALLALAILVYFFMKKKRERTAPPVSPWERAISELGKAKELMTPDKGLLYMERASFILRRYIETRFGIRSTRQTTTEFLHGLDFDKNQDLQPFRGELQLCLEQADMAKFAHLPADTLEMTSMEESVTGFVHSTIPSTEETGEKV